MIQSTTKSVLVSVLKPVEYGIPYGVTIIFSDKGMGHKEVVRLKHRARAPFLLRACCVTDAYSC